MKKDKAWLKEALMGLTFRVSEIGKVRLREVFELVDQLDEPQKPIIPQFVADWIEEERANIIDWHTEIPERFFLILGHKLHYTALANTNISDWVFGGNEEKLYQALKYGYEVERQKKYRVVFNSQTDDLILFQTGKHLFIGAESANDGYWKQHFTEAEIKDYDERYWAFAEEATE